LYSVKYLQQQHGWSPAQVSVLYVSGGAIAILGAPIAGALSDRIGRRRLTAAAGVLLVGLFLGFYNAAGLILAPLWIALIFVLIGHESLLATFGAELFPTSHRSTAAGARLIVITVGGSLGLALESVLYPLTGSHWHAISLLLGVTLIAPLVVALALPETAGKTLEEISPERDEIIFERKIA
jgi:MHS family proline/betaine transporter-like MFS transporter